MQQKFISIIFQTKDNFVIRGEIRTAAAGLVRSATGVKYLQVITIFTEFQVKAGKRSDRLKIYCKYVQPVIL